jgi:Protein of unknown function (DUF3800)
MSWLLFMDESGHDHKNTPFEVRGGVAISTGKLWSFIQSWRRLEESCFGTTLGAFGKEAKGQKLLDKDRFKWAAQCGRMDDEARRKLARTFLERGLNKQAQSSETFAAYGQASLEMARGVFDVLSGHDAKLFATLIPKGVSPPSGFVSEDLLRKDHVFLLERFFYFLDGAKTHGLLVMDETDKALDKRFVKRMEAYFERTATGRNRASWIVPSPLFVASDMNFAVQAADICLYCINWGYRLPSWGEHQIRKEVADEFAPKVSRLRWKGKGTRGVDTFESDGIVLVRDPYESRK